MLFPHMQVAWVQWANEQAYMDGCGWLTTGSLVCLPVEPSLLAFGETAKGKGSEDQQCCKIHSS